MSKTHLTIKETAKALDVSEQTIRRRITKGEIPAEKMVSEFGERWLIPISFIEVATATVDVVPVTRQVSVAEIEKALTGIIDEVVQKHTKSLQEEIHLLRLQVALLREDRRTWWQKIFDRRSNLQ